MKKIIIILIGIIAAYVVAVALLRVTGACPEFIDFMPQIVDTPGQESNGAKTLYKLKLCPFSEAVY